MNAPSQPYTPAHLRDAGLVSREARDGERRQVTVLFCSLAGAAGLAADLGPERMHALLERFFARALSEVERYEGTVNQFLDDGVMALFGAPLAHEDHARRAVLAALALQRAARELEGAGPLSACIGINTGPVVVGSVGDHLRMDYTAVGDATNIAWRLVQAASGGDILVGENTARLAHGYVRMERLPALVLKGRATPLALWRVLGHGPRRGRIDAAADGMLNEFVGREDELAHLEALLARAESGRGQVLAVLGEPGAGKSRLIREFRRRVATRSITWLEGRCMPSGEAVPYGPVLDILRQNCRLGEAERPEAIAAKVRASLREVGVDVAAGAPPLLRLLGVPDAGPSLEGRPDLSKARTFEVLRQMALGGSRRRPLVIVVEDLHWVDALSEEYAGSLAERAAGAPLLLIFTYRPGYRPRWGERASGTQLSLSPLGPGESRKLVHAAGAGRLSEAIADRIVERAEGNPLFLEELARAAAESGDDAVEGPAPDTVQDVVRARVDRLPESARRLLQCAAVLGREFAASMLRAVCEEPATLEGTLRLLTHLEFLDERFGPVESTFVFKHALVREVIHGSMLGRQRRALHERAVAAAEARGGSGW